MNKSIYYCDKCHKDMTSEEPKYAVEISEIYNDTPYRPEKFDYCRECVDKLYLPENLTNTGQDPRTWGSPIKVMPDFE